MGKYVAEVQDHLVLPARVRATYSPFTLVSIAVSSLEFDFPCVLTVL